MAIAKFSMDLFGPIILNGSCCPEGSLFLVGEDGSVKRIINEKEFYLNRGRRFGVGGDPLRRAFQGEPYNPFSR
jgi:hypothetical protein